MVVVVDFLMGVALVQDNYNDQQVEIIQANNSLNSSPRLFHALFIALRKTLQQSTVTIPSRCFSVDATPSITGDRSYRDVTGQA